MNVAKRTAKLHNIRHALEQQSVRRFGSMKSNRVDAGVREASKGSNAYLRRYARVLGV